VDLYLQANYLKNTARCSVVDRSKYATNSKLAGSIPDGSIGIFKIPNQSSRTMALGSTLPLAVISIKKHSEGKGWPAFKADNLIAICEPIVKK
jgi:hypothetical protein